MSNAPLIDCISTQPNGDTYAIMVFGPFDSYATAAIVSEQIRSYTDFQLTGRTHLPNYLETTCG